MMITSDISYIGVNDYMIDLFEGMYPVKNGMSYNSYLIMDERIAVFDTVDAGFTLQWMQNMQEILGKRKPDYLIVQHMEPDHSANIKNFLEKYPNTTLVASKKAFVMMKNFFGRDLTENRIEVGDGDMISLGKHKLHFAEALMVHWPEVIVTYDSTDKVLFSADAFGKFGTPDTDEEWLDEARRYYIGIVGKYGVPVQKLLAKLSAWDIQTICPLHGPVLKENLQYYIEKYNTWSLYQPEEEGILIAYTSIYGNTKKAVMLLADALAERGCKNVIVRDLARCDITQVVAEAFKYSKLVLATTTYNVGIFPFMREFISWLTERNFANRTIAFIENGSWMPVAAQLMQEKFKDSRGITFVENNVKILSALSGENILQIEMLADELCKRECEIM
ncbi:MAG: FprA family A-type flavoprotein [Lachnospiraceae bacterium]|nr:FprA family A-type flavoprotein [Lachnospiraceae bacterium]